MSAQHDFFGDHARLKAEKAADRLAKLDRAYRCSIQNCPSKGPFYGSRSWSGMLCNEHRPAADRRAA